jgi:C-terminal processing protease CtpA/Prc
MRHLPLGDAFVFDSFAIIIDYRLNDGGSLKLAIKVRTRLMKVRRQVVQYNYKLGFAAYVRKPAYENNDCK